MSTSIKLSPPEPDYSAFGPVSIRPLSRIEKLTGAAMARNWSQIPHVTHHDIADVTVAEQLCAELKSDPDKKVTLLALVAKAAAECLKRHPRFNASLAQAGDALVLKSYVNIGVAVNTPRGLVVPVVLGVDGKSAQEVAREIAELATLARSKGVPLDKMSGGSFSISSLGGFGGVAFTPIINAPEVAILGLSRVFDRAVPLDGSVGWSRALPLSLSYDHRVINGADAAVFVKDLANLLERPADLLPACPRCFPED